MPKLVPEGLPEAEAAALVLAIRDAVIFVESVVATLLLLLLLLLPTLTLDNGTAVALGAILPPHTLI